VIADLKPKFANCETEHHQSPSSICNPLQQAALPPVRFEYASPLHVIDNGHTTIVNYNPGSFISIRDKKLALKQFHFHRPRTERINGKGFDMTVLLVHVDDDGKLAIVT
jgi:carbonic anhydrase